MPEQVWICHRGCVHEGGGTEAVCASRAVALDWLRAERVKAEQSAAEQNAFEDEHFGRAVGEPWTVTAIEERDETALFRCSYEIWTIRPMPLLTAFASPSPDAATTSPTPIPPALSRIFLPPTADDGTPP